MSPIVGYNYGGDSGCPNVTGCEDKNLNLGIAIGNYGDLFGLEEEFAYAKDFYGDVAAYESSVVTLMTNVLLSPDVGRIKPYGLVGIGLIKSNVRVRAARPADDELEHGRVELGRRHHLPSSPIASASAAMCGSSRR